MAGKRETLQPLPGDSRSVRRDARGRFTTDQSQAGRSLDQDRRIAAEHEAPKGQGDHGDRTAS